uniref:Uncharacterized protein n=1 Tax=Opuntia streptacantha TaxID=393608 RepID=A0A7C9D9A4_OPUST
MSKSGSFGGIMHFLSSFGYVIFFFYVSSFLFSVLCFCVVSPCLYGLYFHIDVAIFMLMLYFYYSLSYCILLMNVTLPPKGGTTLGGTRLPLFTNSVACD